MKFEKPRWKHRGFFISVQTILSLSPEQSLTAFSQLNLKKSLKKVGQKFGYINYIVLLCTTKINTDGNSRQVYRTTRKESS